MTQWTVTFDKERGYATTESVTFYAEDFHQAYTRIMVAMELAGYAPHNAEIISLEKV